MTLLSIILSFFLTLSRPTPLSKYFEFFGDQLLVTSLSPIIGFATRTESPGIVGIPRHSGV